MEVIVVIIVIKVPALMGITEVLAGAVIAVFNSKANVMCIGLSRVIPTAVWAAAGIVLVHIAANGTL